MAKPVTDSPAVSDTDINLFESNTASEPAAAAPLSAGLATQTDANTERDSKTSAGAERIIE